MSTEVAVVGAGSWGTAMASQLSRAARTVLWARRADLAAQMQSTRRNPSYLSELTVPPELDVTGSIADAVGSAAVIVMAVPSHGFREVLETVVPHMRENVPVISLAKGLERVTLCRMTEIVAEVAPGHPAGVLTGPNLAAEVMMGQPTAGVLALADETVACELQSLFSTGPYRVYTNTDVVGCEIAGALKNVMAIATGIATGLGFGDNTRAALITRGLAELGRLGVTLGADSLTFAGLAGMGDLVATCTSPRSRNRHVGEELGRGRSLDEIVREMQMVAEGVKTCQAAVGLARRNGVEMPISEQVVAVIYEGRPPRDVIPALLRRRARPELDWVHGNEPSGGATRGDGLAAASELALGTHEEPLPVEGPVPGSAATAAERLKAFLGAAGIDPGEIALAESEGTLNLLAIDAVLVPRDPRLTPVEVSERSGLPLDHLHRMWRAMGFADVGDHDAVLSELDVEGFRIMQDLLVINAVNVDPAVQLMRVMGSAMARVAEAEVAAAGELVGVSDRNEVADLFVETARATVPGIGRLLEYVWRRHLEVASHRVILREPGSTSSYLAVGFADLVGFTVLSQELDDEALAKTVERFETLAHETVTSRVGRVVKMIGDEAMYAVEDVGAAARIGLDLSEAYADDEILSDVRVGIAAGPVVARDGDYYGSVVNTASRIVNIARPGSVLTTDEVHAALEDDPELEWRPLRPRELKDIGEVQLWSLRRPGATAGRRDQRVWTRVRRAHG